MRPNARLPWVDMLRGVALVGMVAYHAAWDLHAYGSVALDPSRDPGWLLFGRCVAAMFLALSGFGLSLARRRGATMRAMVGRLFRIAMAAALVSLATWFAVPDAPVWFGILHCIVVANALTLILGRLPSGVMLLCAAAAVLVPFGWRGGVGASWAWTGLAASEPHTVDFRPVLPWLGPVLLGFVLGRTSIFGWGSPALARSALLRPLAAAGRHSLAIYLIHQPIMIGILAVTHGTLPQTGTRVPTLSDPGQAGAFLEQCRASCVKQGTDEALCGSTCYCVLTGLLSRTGSQDLDDAVAVCRPASRTGTAP